MADVCTVRSHAILQRGLEISIQKQVEDGRKIKELRKTPEHIADCKSGTADCPKAWARAALEEK